MQIKKREILDDIYREILDLKRDILDLKKQLNDLTTWQLRSLIPPNTPSIPVVKCDGVCGESCKHKKDLDF